MDKPRPKKNYTAYRKGVTARLNGENLTDNPYPSDDLHRAEWRGGWLDTDWELAQERGKE